MFLLKLIDTIGPYVMLAISLVFLVNVDIPLLGFVLVLYSLYFIYESVTK
jgi:hypothetical protein